MREQPGWLDRLDSVRQHLGEGRVQEGLRSLEEARQQLPLEPALRVEGLVHLVRLSAQYDRAESARGWIREAAREVRRAARSCPEPTAELLSELNLLALYVSFSEERSLRTKRRIERAFSALRLWKPWMVDFRLLFLLNEHRMTELERFLRKHPPCPIRRGSLEYARRLLYLGIRYEVDGCAGPALTVLKAALRKLEEVPGLESLAHQARTLCWIARSHAQTGEIEKALSCARAAERVARRAKPPRFRFFRNETYGQIYHSAGEYEKALRVHLDTCLASSRRSFPESSSTAMAFLRSARSALLLGRPDQARRLIERAAPRARAVSQPWLLGTLWLLRGDLAREAGTPAGLRKARIHYDRAERIFQSQGSGDRWWLGQVSISRGALHLKERKFGLALRQATLSMEIGRRTGALDTQAASVLLRSSLLVEEEAPRSDLYEEVLRQLGLVREPVVLFKVIANLYMYSWDLGGEHLELTDLHLKQLHRLRDSMPPRVYDRLYRTCVTERVVARFRGRFAGGGFESGKDGGRRAASS